MLAIPVENLIVDGESQDEGVMTAADDDASCGPPFALFSPDLQVNVGGPYATREHANAALELIKQGGMIPYTFGPHATWTIDGKPSKWYDK
jgi:hypothetical protein